MVLPVVHFFETMEQMLTLRTQISELTSVAEGARAARAQENIAMAQFVHFLEPFDGNALDPEIDRLLTNGPDGRDGPNGPNGPDGDSQLQCRLCSFVFRMFMQVCHHKYESKDMDPVQCAIQYFCITLHDPVVGVATCLTLSHRVEPRYRIEHLDRETILSDMEEFHLFYPFPRPPAALNRSEVYSTQMWL